MKRYFSMISWTLIVLCLSSLPARVRCSCLYSGYMSISSYDAVGRQPSEERMYLGRTTFEIDCVHLCLNHDSLCQTYTWQEYCWHEYDSYASLYMCSMEDFNANGGSCFGYEPIMGFTWQQSGLDVGFYSGSCIAPSIARIRVRAGA